MSSKISAQQLATDKLHNYVTVSFKTPYRNSQYIKTMNNLYSRPLLIYPNKSFVWISEMLRYVKEYSYYMEMLIIMDYMEMLISCLLFSFTDEL